MVDHRSILERSVITQHGSLADVLLDGSTDLQTALSDEYSNSANFSDGEIYLRLREYSMQTNRSAGTSFAEKCMLSRLSRDKRNDLKQLLKHRPLVAALDALRVFPGLWYGFQIGHKWINKCVEVIAIKPPKRFR